MKVTYLGTTMLLFDDGTDQILFDCHVTRPSIPTYLFGKMITNTEVSDRVIKDFRISRLRAIFISHSHHDHVMDAPYFAIRTGAEIYGSPSALNVARGGGVDEERLHSYKDCMEYQVGGYQIRIIPSIHSKPNMFNNDLGQTIDTPLVQPARKQGYKEGGSFDFLVKNGDKTYLIRPSYNYLEGQLDGIQADVLYIGVTGLAKDTQERQKKFFEETIDKVHPQTVVPVHWDYFFGPLYGKIKGLPAPFDNTKETMRILTEHCAGKGIHFVIQQPLTTLEF